MTTPAPTPIARLWVISVARTVESITVVSLLGIAKIVLILCQSNVAYATTIITATSAAMGISATTSPNDTTKIKRNTPARNVESRVRAPERTLIIV